MSSFPAGQTNQENVPLRVSVVVAYEDYDAGKRAQKACQQLLQLTHLEKSLSTDLWKFDMLKLRAMRAAAVEEAAEADLLVVAPQDGADLPVGVREWIQESLLHPLRPQALLVLAGPARKYYERPPPAELQLEQIAALVRCPFWCLRLEPPAGAWSEPAYLVADLERVAQALFPQSPIAFFSLLPGFLARRDRR